MFIIKELAMYIYVLSFSVFFIISYKTIHIQSRRVTLYLQVPKHDHYEAYEDWSVLPQY